MGSLNAFYYDEFMDVTGIPDMYAAEFFYSYSKNDRPFTVFFAEIQASILAHYSTLEIDGEPLEVCNGSGDLDPPLLQCAFSNLTYA